MVITCDEKVMLTKTLVSENKLRYINFQRLEKALAYVKNNLIDSDNNMYLAVDSLIDIINIITSSNDITLRYIKNLSFT